MRKSQYIFVIPIVLLLGSIFFTISNIYPVDGQTNSVNLTTSNSTGPVINTNSANQTSQDNQTASKTNLTSHFLSDPLLNEKLLNYTNNAILALNDDNETEIQRNLVYIQDELIKAIGKPIVIVPAPALITGSSSNSESD
jgi:hypothetical protein